MPVRSSLASASVLGAAAFAFVVPFVVISSA